MKTLLEVVDELDTAHDLVTCAYMAAGTDVPKEWGDPIQTVMRAATDKLEAIRDAVEEIRDVK